MTIPIGFIVFAMVVLAIHFVPGLRAGFYLFLGGGLHLVSGVLKKIYNKAPAWMPVVANALRTAATTTGGIINGIAVVVSWTLAFLALLIGVGIAFNNTAILVIVTLACAILVLILRGPLSLIPWGIDDRAREYLGRRAMLLLWIAALLLFVPQVTVTSFTSVLMIVISSYVVWLYRQGDLFRKIQFYSAWAIIGITVTISLFAPVHTMWSNWRFGNMNQQILANAQDRIEELNQLDISKDGGLSEAERNERDRLINERNRKQTAASNAETLRGSVKLRMPRMRMRTETTLLLLGLAIVGLGTLLIATKPSDGGGHH